jgi:hypothetical protein
MRNTHVLSRLLLMLVAGGLALASASPARAAPPSNDDFDHAVVIGALPFSDSRDTRDATFANDDPPCTPLFRTEEATVWYAFTPASDQQVLISTAGSSYNATLAVFTGARGALSQVASICENPVNAQVRFDAVAGTTYFVMIGVFVSQPISNLTLSVAAVPPPANDDIATAAAIASLPYAERRDVRAATASASDPYCSGQGRTVWYILTPALSGRIVVSSWGSTFGTVLGVYTGAPGALSEVACSLSGVSTRLVFDATAATTYYIVVGADNASQADTLRLSVDRAGGNDTIDAAYPAGDLPLYDERDRADLSASADDPACFESGATAWYRYAPATAERLSISGRNANVGVYRGAPGSLIELTCGKADPFFGGGGFAAINAAASTTYYIGIGVPASASFIGPISVHIRAGPGNDDFDAAAPIEVLPFSAPAELRGSTGDIDDPGCGGGIYGGANLWYAYRAVDDRLLEASARATGFDAEIGVYTGARGSLVQQACGTARNDPTGQGRASAIFHAAPGQTYYIVVGTSFYLDNITDTRLTVGLDTAPPTPANDDFAQPVVVSSLPFDNGQDGRIATTSADDPACGNRIGTYWYTYTPAENQRVLASTGGAVLGVYTGARGHLHEITCSSVPYNPQFVYLDLVGGTTYFFMVAGGGDSGTVGWLNFHMEQLPPPPPPLNIGVSISPQAHVLVKSGQAQLNVTITCSREAYISISGQLEQRIGRRTISGPASGWVYCTGTVQTALSVSATRGRFIPYTAHATVDVAASDLLTGAIVNASATRTIRLTPKIR